MPTSSPRKSANRDAEQRMRRFLEARDGIFSVYNKIVAFCKKSLNGEFDQRRYELARVVLKDLARFEDQFLSFESQFWDYIFNVNNYRDVIENLSVRHGFSDQKEYFFSEIEKIISTINEVLAEFQADGVYLSALEDIEDRLEELFDSSESLIEIDPEDIDDEGLSLMMGLVPPQKTAPIEVIVIHDRIGRRPPRKFEHRLSNSSINNAIIALREVVRDARDELIISNCDPRFRRAFERCVDEINKDVNIFSPIQFGIFVGLLSSMSYKIEEESSPSFYSQMAATIYQCQIFLRNFDEWNKYIEEVDSNGNINGVWANEFSNYLNDEIFDEEIRSAVIDLSKAQAEFDGGNEKLKYAVTQSIVNIISEVARQGLRFVGILAKRAMSFGDGIAEDGAKYAIGILCADWIRRNASYLLDLSEKHAVLSWIRPIVDFIKTQIGA